MANNDISGAEAAVAAVTEVEAEVYGCLIMSLFLAELVYILPRMLDPASPLSKVDHGIAYYLTFGIAGVLLILMEISIILGRKHNETQ